MGVKAGTLTHTEVLDSELELFRARAGVVKAQLDAIESLINLEMAMGKKLPGLLFTSESSAPAPHFISTSKSVSAS